MEYMQCNNDEIQTGNKLNTCRTKVRNSTWKQMEYKQYNNDENHPGNKWNKCSAKMMKFKQETNGIHAVQK